MMCIIFPITVRLLQNNERSFPLIFTITVVELKWFHSYCMYYDICCNISFRCDVTLTLTCHRGSSIPYWFDARQEFRNQESLWQYPGHDSSEYITCIRASLFCWMLIWILKMCMCQGFSFLLIQVNLGISNSDMSNTPDVSNWVLGPNHNYYIIWYKELLISRTWISRILRLSWTII
jgi:hypothetical protein